MQDVIGPDGEALLAGLRAGEWTAGQIADAFLERIQARHPLIGAWAWLDQEAVRDQAAALDGSASRGPLHGLPVAIKDVIATLDMPTEHGSDLYRGHRPAADAACVRMLRQAGALILGKTTTVELASVGRPPATRNPHATEHTPGGSSSGSAAAVADGQVPIALGTQTGGSIIRPASFCGTWALKPSWGLVSTEGVKPFAPSLDTVGWFGRSAADLALLLQLFDPRPALPARCLAGARVAIWRTEGWPRAEPATQAAMEQAIGSLARAGAEVVEFEFAFPRLAEDQLAIMHAEGQRSFLADYRAGPDKLHPRIAEMVRSANGVSPDRLRLAHDRAGAARAAFDDLAGGFDAVLSPSTIGTAPHGLAATGDLLFNGLLTLLHVPAINLPFWRGSDGLPVGLTLSGPRWSDHVLLAFAAAWERIVRGP